MIPDSSVDSSDSQSRIAIPKLKQDRALFPIEHDQNIIELQNKYSSVLKACVEIEGEWSDSYVHLEYWQLGYHSIP